MAVQNILADAIWSSGWTDYDQNIRSNEMYQRQAGRVVGLWIKPAGDDWQWEVFGDGDVTLETGIERSETDAKTAAEASSKRILLAAA